MKEAPFTQGNLSTMQNVMEGQTMFGQFHQQSPRSAPTAIMVDPNAHYRPKSAGLVQEQNVVEEPASEPSIRHTPKQTLTRALPSPNVDDSSIDDAYVQFIFYCNPSVPLSTDTVVLRRGFRSMPKTDGNQFVLFGLIKKLEAKDIETWSQLVAELGVEPPDAAKNQSSQKVQQFAVRLKVTTSRV